MVQVLGSVVACSAKVLIPSDCYKLGNKTDISTQQNCQIACKTMVPVATLTTEFREVEVICNISKTLSHFFVDMILFWRFSLT